LDPAGLGNFEWTDIGNLLTYLWVAVAFVLFSATSLLVGHALIPSLAESFHLPPNSQKTRSAFYMLAAVFFGLAAVALYMAIDLSDVLARFWNDYWI